ncbi:TVP38/TMEM64 family protein [Rubripirellula reticaptiva]|uniref:TVP38/TMEM64 family membrane protein n=1 Tax=Rubripirellula reticaptiva TaxID=2528013 RepID=A0A5C6ED60_9BACT|nr:VTT domain-containing protein [Rubripirellula reticaptiva]TWU46858.1 SNARE associated Golgi protein [Rubripirellula reticaptiva]
MTTAEADTSLEQKDVQARESADAKPSRSVNRKLRMLFAGSILTLMAYLYWQDQLTQESLKQFGAALPTWLFLPAYLVLPLFGFPISVALLASGLKYGFALSILIAFVGMAFHTFVAWHIAHGNHRRRLEAWLSQTRFELPTIPERHQIWFTALFVTVPGLPYALKLYSLALTNLPFRRYMFIVWFCHVMNSVVFIGLGAAAAKVDPKLMIGAAVLAVLMLAISTWLKALLNKRSANNEVT